MSHFLEMYFTVLSYLQFCLSVIILTYLSNILHIYFARLHQYQNIFFCAKLLFGFLCLVVIVIV